MYPVFIMKEIQKPLWADGPIYSSKGSYPLSTDSIVLADFIHLKKNIRVADFGCGSGILGLLLYDRCPSISLINIDIQQSAVKAASENMTANGYTDNIDYYCADFRDMSRFISPGSFDMIISNPPYFSSSQGEISPEHRRTLSRTDIMCSLDELCISAARYLRFGGEFCIVFKPERLAELFQSMRSVKIEPKRIRYLQHSIRHKASLVMIEGKLGGKPGLITEPVLILYTADGSPTEETKRIYHIL